MRDEKEEIKGGQAGIEPWSLWWKRAALATALSHLRVILGDLGLYKPELTVRCVNRFLPLTGGIGG
mgnify:CR=1 FL=1